MVEGREESYPVGEPGSGCRSPGVARALGVRIVLVAAGKECDFYLGRERGACEGFKQEWQSQTCILKRPNRLQVGALGVEGLEWRLNSVL